MGKIAARVWNSVELIGVYWSVALLLFAMIAVIAGSLSRRLPISVPGASQYAEYAMIHITFLAAAWTLKEDGHIRAGLLIRAVGARTEAVLETMISLVGATALFLVAYMFWEQLANDISSNRLLIGAVFVNRYWISGPAALGSFMLGIAFLVKAYSSATRFSITD